MIYYVWLQPDFRHFIEKSLVSLYPTLNVIGRHLLQPFKQEGSSQLPLVAFPLVLPPSNAFSFELPSPTLFRSPVFTGMFFRMIINEQSTFILRTYHLFNTSSFLTNRTRYLKSRYYSVIETSVITAEARLNPALKFSLSFAHSHSYFMYALPFHSFTSLTFILISYFIYSIHYIYYI